MRSDAQIVDWQAKFATLVRKTHDPAKEYPPAMQYLTDHELHWVGEHLSEILGRAPSPELTDLSTYLIAEYQRRFSQEGWPLPDKKK
jgi:hypothetical protein